VAVQNDVQWPGPLGWLACLAVSSDPTLRTWTKLGAVLRLGAPGSVDAKSASYLTAFLREDGTWLGWYLGTNQTSPPPFDVPIGPYFTLLASAPSSSGPWTQHSSLGNVIGSGSPGVVMLNPKRPDRVVAVLQWLRRRLDRARDDAQPDRRVD